MNLKEALIALVEGKKIRRYDWTKGLHIYMDGCDILDEGGLGYPNLRGSDWELYEEPKLKRKFYRRKWVLYETGVVPVLRLDNPYYSTIAEFDDLCAHIEINEVSDEIEEIEI